MSGGRNHQLDRCVGRRWILQQGCYSSYQWHGFDPILCAHKEQNVWLTFFGVSPKTGLYRAELLGLLAINILVSAIE